MMKKLLAIICTLAILATAVPTVFAQNDVLVNLSDFESVDAGTVMENQVEFYDGWFRQGSAESGVIAEDESGNNYAKLITAGGYNELIRNFPAIDDSVVKSVRVSGRTIFHDNYLRRAVILRGSFEGYYVYFNTDRTVTVGSGSVLPGFTYQDDVWYDYTIDFKPSTGYVVFSITDSDGTTYTCDGYGGGGNTGLWRVDFITPSASVAQASQWGIDDVEVTRIPAVKEYIINSGFEEIPTNTALGSSPIYGWRFAANGGSGCSATVLTENGNNYVHFVPGSSTTEFFNNFAPESNTQYVNSVNLEFRTMFEGKNDRRIMLRAAGEYYYVYFTADGKVRAGSNEIRNFTYQENVWYDISLNFNPSTGYVNVTVSDGDRLYKAQGYGSAQTNRGLWRVNFVQSAATGTSWNIDDVKFCETDPASEYEETVIIDNENFSGFTAGTELTGTLTNSWRAVGNTELGTSIKAVADNDNQYIRITAGTNHYTEFFQEFTAKDDTDRGYKLNFSIMFEDYNFNKHLYLRGEGGEEQYIRFTQDGKVYVGGESGEFILLPGFTYDLNTWYDFTAEFNPSNGQIYVSVKDGDKTYGTWGNGVVNNKLFRVNFVVKDGLEEGTTSYCIDNVNLERTEASTWNHYEISDVEYSVDSITAGDISASVSGQIHGKNATLFLALYSKSNGKMVEVDAVPVKPEGYAKDFVATVSVPSDYTNYAVRAFLFDSSLVPVQTIGAINR